ncbi:TPA: restriction endonuclease subunit S [Streptococcus suis]|nr:restriction endonuclease subunit S [Streptococcus suis]
MRKLGEDLLSIQTGTNRLGTETGAGTPLLKMGNIQRGYFLLDKLEYFSSSDIIEPENIANYGDFFFNTRNTLELVGKGATWMGESGIYAFNNNIARFKLRKIDTIFFNYLYNTNSMLKQISSRAMGTTSVAAIYPQSLKSVEYFVPNLVEQSAIGTFFSTLDQQITLHQRKSI